MQISGSSTTTYSHKLIWKQKIVIRREVCLFAWKTNALDIQRRADWPLVTFWLGHLTLRQGEVEVWRLPTVEKDTPWFYYLTSAYSKTSILNPTWKTQMFRLAWDECSLHSIGFSFFLGSWHPLSRSPSPSSRNWVIYFRSWHDRKRCEFSVRIQLKLERHSHG